MTLEAHKIAILQALRARGRGVLKLGDEREVWADITEAATSVQNFQIQQRVEAKRDRTGKHRRDYYDDLFSELKRSQSLVRKLINDAYLKEPMGWAAGDWVDEDDLGGWWYVDWNHVGPYLEHALSSLKVLTNWVGAAKQLAAGEVITHRPTLPETQLLDKLVYSLAVIYFRHTGKYPAFSNGNFAHFDRFFEAVARAMGLNFKPSSLKSAIRRLDPKRNPHFQLDANEPKPDRSRSMEEVFADIIGKSGQ